MTKGQFGRNVIAEMHFRQPTHPDDAFSLIELLVVVAIIGMLAAFAIPAFNSIGQAKGASEAAYQIAAAVELARSEAVSRQTFVWLGFQPATNFGNIDLGVGMVYSKDGSSANTNATNLQPIGRPLLIQHVALTNAAALDVGTNLSGVPDVSGSPTGVAFQIGRVQFAGGPTLTFTPMGEVTTNGTPAPTDGFDPRLSVGLRQTKGSTLTTNNDVVLIIDGSVGLPSILRR